jgi:predicted aconitase with swiveling domain
MEIRLDPIIAATSNAAGPALVLSAPISFWGGVDPKSGDIIDAHHPDVGRNIAGTVLCMPGTIGSSSASAVLLELVHAGRAPAAILMPEPDAILLMGLIIAGEMGWAHPPAFRLAAKAQGELQGRVVSLSPDGVLGFA